MNFYELDYFFKRILHLFFRFDFFHLLISLLLRLNSFIHMDVRSITHCVIPLVGFSC